MWKVSPAVHPISSDTERIYGGSKRNGSCPLHFCKSSGGVARHILQQLQTMNIVDIDTKGGMKITSSGPRDLDHLTISLLRRLRFQRLSVGNRNKI